MNCYFEKNKGLLSPITVASRFVSVLFNRTLIFFLLEQLDNNGRASQYRRSREIRCRVVRATSIILIHSPISTLLRVRSPHAHRYNVRLNPYVPHRGIVYTRRAGNTMYYRSTTLMFALNNYSGIVVPTDTYVSAALLEKRISATLSSKRDTHAACDNTTERRARIRRDAYGIHKRPTPESVDGSLSKSSIYVVHERI